MFFRYVIICNIGTMNCISDYRNTPISIAVRQRDWD